MTISNGKKYYLNDGKLDLSILDEAVIGEIMNDEPVNAEQYSTLLEELESMEISNVDISSTLEEMAMIFEQEDEFKKAFNEERLQEEIKEFGKTD